ncbi:MAG: hypothetical protein HOP28_00760 [Gemmatimonadales bacterium]|nr:hypothetical protein [Gemmatimonadales bacterium]
MTSRVLPLLLALAACAPARPAPGVTPEQLALLDARRAARPNDAGSLTDVGIAFYRAGEFSRAKDALTAALALTPSFRAAVHLGLAYEGLGDREAALDAYRLSTAMRATAAERRPVETRLIALTRERLALEARRAVAEEARLSALPPAPNTIAVLPWVYLGGNPELKPLERGLAHLVMSDLARVSRLTLVERERVQAIEEELALAGGSRTEPGTAARSGRLLRAAAVVQGVIRESPDGALRLDANVVDAITTSVRATESVSDRLERLFAMEKAVVLGLLSELQITLSPAERRAITERPTADLQAFLSFSRGLEALDRGDVAGAGVLFQEAVRRDPSFAPAREKAAATVASGAAAKMTPARLAAMAGRSPTSARAAQLSAALHTIAPSLASRLARAGLATRAPSVRSRIAEALRQDDASRVGAVSQATGTIPRP